MKQSLGLIAFLCFFSSLSFAASGINLRASLSNRSRQLNLRLRTPNDLECSGLAMVSARALRISSKSSTQLIEPFAGEKSVSFLNLNRIKSSAAKKSTFFTLKLNCADGKIYAKRVEIILPTTRARSGLTLGQWIGRVRTQIASRFSAAPFPPAGLSIVAAFPQLLFSSPIDLQDPADGTGRLFVVEQSGRIYSIINNEQSSSKSLLLNITDKILAGGERGLLGLAVDPNFSSNHYLYVNYTRKPDGATIIARYTAPSTVDQLVDIQSELIYLTIPQPFDNHNGGGLQFGADGLLYIAIGDGGSGGDPLGNGQKLDTLLGKILRIDVHNPSGGLNYGIPISNPFIGQAGAQEEIYAYGLRNPWRISFDFPTNRFWVADVGQGAREEVNLVTSGKNYGWNKMEGAICYPSGGTSCDMNGLELPLIDYEHALGKSVTGGYTYRGSSVRALEGVYIYGDFISGRIWGIRGVATLEHAQLIDTTLSISSFGRANDGELFIVDYNGSIYRFSQ